MGKRANGEGSWNFSSTKKLYTYRYTFPEGENRLPEKQKRFVWNASKHIRHIEKKMESGC